MSLLERLGYTDVKHFSGGIGQWLERGMPLDSGGEAQDVESAPVRARASAWRGSAVLLDALGERSVGQLLALWLGMVLVFGVAYWLAGWAGDALLSDGHRVGQDGWGLLSSEYFSFVTALSVGYGDVIPLGPARALAVAEAASGLLVFGGVVSKFVSRRQDQLIAEIHLTTFMDRLARVRTNLHMVLSELHTLIEMCVESRAVATLAERGATAGPPVSPDRVMIRTESLSLVFLGELRSIHDLLYRPQQTPDESILEGLLAELAAVMGELTELCRCLPPGVPRSRTLEEAIRSVATMALEICGDCVPRQYAPHLRGWMDRVQELGRTLGALWP